MGQKRLVNHTIKENVKKEKKSYTTPLKEKARREQAIRKAEQKISMLEEKIASIQKELEREENISDYIKLSKLQQEYEQLDNELMSALEEWEALSEAIN